jgi:Peroxisomal biogenesis factor 11 (PEX11)
MLAYFEARSPARSAFLRRFIKLTNPQLRPSRDSVSESASPLKTLATLISDTRMALRLTALLPLYVWLQELLKDNKRQDQYLRALSLTQCLSYIVYQFTENVAFLADRRVISQKWLEKKGGSTRWWMISNRAWLAGVSCDFLLLFRKAYIERESRRSARKTDEEAEILAQQSFDRAWWNDVFVASCWLPLCVHYSLQDGLKGVGTGVVGLLGFMAGIQSFMAQWAKTEQHNGI